ncbi:hypothetical protein Ais01nite_12800 [Asanoa ishikariensis]|uniref:Tetratricopeptide repeat-containing protein n=1 Tax=Asanoa ishikariensis TaxID=137265 RepID=A0A1H3SYL1_9ACTN|nr:caspase family protein [Asanoa ishikariensis]GIF63245.1 hypothetical protein Ais01nite_12800 [Asanoa ishikariensis]SDZ43072.1 Tetratricopeptide repeat-containing protein [Asanoa ishikariensis]
MRLPNAAVSQAVLIGVADYPPESGLTPVPAAKTNLADLASALTDQDAGGFTPDNCRILTDPDDLAAVGVALQEAVEAADDVLLIYFVGHGLVDETGELMLALPGTRPNLPWFTALPWTVLRRQILSSRAATRVLIMDCCYSGRAIDALDGGDEALTAQFDIAGTYILTSTSRTEIAHAPPEEPHTAFTGELIRLLREGIDGATPLLTLDSLFTALRTAHRRRGLPPPHRSGTDSGADLALARNRAYRETIIEPLGPHHPETLARRVALANEVGAQGQLTRAAAMFGEILDAFAAAGLADTKAADDARFQWAVWTGFAGDPATAAERLATMATERAGRLGEDDPATLSVRHQHALWAGRAGGALAAAEAMTEVAERRRAVLGQHHPDTAASELGLVRWTGRSGFPQRAYELASQLASQLPRSGDLLASAIASEHAIWAYEADLGLARDACTALTAYVDATARQHRQHHPWTLLLTRDLDHWTGIAGDTEAAATGLAVRVAELTEAAGPRHPDALLARQLHGRWSCAAPRAGDLRPVETDLSEVVAVQSEVLGADHPDTLVTRRVLALCRDRGSGADVTDELADIQRIQSATIGSHHPETLATEFERWRILGRQDGMSALEVAEALAANARSRAVRLGASHRDTTASEWASARWYGQAGNPTLAIEKLKRVRNTLVLLSGVDDPLTLAAGHDIARWTGETGDLFGAVALLSEAITARERVIGEYHRETFRSRHLHAVYLARGGSTREAALLLADLIDDQRRHLGPDDEDVTVSLADYREANRR